MVGVPDNEEDVIVYIAVVVPEDADLEEGTDKTAKDTESITDAASAAQSR